MKLKRILILFYLKFILVQCKFCSNSTLGTTGNFKEIFLGRCFYFLNILHKNNCMIKSANLNCTQIWKEFSNVILNRNPCEIKKEDFDNFLNMTSHFYDTEKAILWSGTDNMAHQISRLRGYWTLEDVLPGYLYSELTACSNSNKTDFEKECESECMYGNNAFWTAVSIDFARHSTKQVIVILNGTRTEGAAPNRTYFMRFELPNLNYESVKKVKVLLLHSPDKPKYETCSNPITLRYVETFLKSKNVAYECEDDTFFVNNINCIQNPTEKHCETLPGKNFQNSNELETKQFESMSTESAYENDSDDDHTRVLKNETDINELSHGIGKN
ncbi:unnamed protein product [Brachionus calyciflorus]|uniref:ADP-ribosyl cyclase/cyclic ADP-ribose hydrolase n=1 Tax=Brachionus calyciflorus TaxID=104777 RepID=A0A813TMG7_9BILA|nr:unnamed protein product [Brachionus calyciflorus]